MFNYNFFDYKDFIPAEDKQNVMWSLSHILFIILASLAIILLCIFLRKTKKEKIDRYLKILSVVMIVLEIIKISWESYWDIKMGHGFNINGLLPLYTCSMFMYVLPFVAWGKGKVKEIALAFLTTLSIFAGLTNFVMPPIFNDYPFFSYASFMSLNYHFLMVFTGFFLIVSKYYMPNIKSIFKAFIPVLIFSALVIPFDYYMYYVKDNPWVDYMQYLHAYNVPVLQDVARGLNDKGLTFLNTLMMMIVYLGITSLFAVIFQSIYKLFKIKQSNRGIE